ncbi:MAG: DMT family transporter [Candidatus Eisenbacteria bacterium]
MTDLALVLTTLIWGSTFITVKDALEHISPMRFVLLRFGVAAVVLFAVAILARARFDRATWRAGALASLPFFLSFLTQTFGLVWASPATSAFLTGFSVVLVPVFSVVFLGRAIEAWTWAGAIAALVGLGALSVRGDWTIGPGELWTIGTAIAVACHVLVLERVAPGKSAIALTAVQVLGCTVWALLCLPLDALLLKGGATLRGLFEPLPSATLLAVLYMGCAATALAFFLQTWAQARMSAVRVGVLFTLEPVFALMFSIALGRERFTPRTLVGMALILAGMLLVETLGRRGPRATA